MSEWRASIRRELERYHCRTGEDVVTSQELFHQAEHRLTEQFPKAETPKRTMSKTLGELVEREEINRIDDGTYRILSLNIEDIDVCVLSKDEREFLRQWKETLESQDRGRHFKLREHNLSEKTRGDALQFIEEPSEETFKQFWNHLHSAGQGGTGKQIYDKWADGGGTDGELAAIIDEILNAESYNPGWEEQLGAYNTLQELFGVFHIDTQPMINNSTKTGLSVFGYPSSNDYNANKRYFEDFKVDYDQSIGHVRDDIVPINLEIDQLFNVLDKVKEPHIEEAETPAEAELYRLAIKLRDEGPDPEELADIPGQIWQISPGRVRYGLWPTMREAGVIAMGYGRGDLSEQSEEEIREDVSTDDQASMAYRFGHDVDVGDLVIAKKGSSRGVYGIGVVTTSSYYDPEHAEELFPSYPGHDNFLGVDWILSFNDGGDGRKKITDLKRAFYQGTIADYSRYEDLIKILHSEYPETRAALATIKQRSEELQDPGSTEPVEPPEHKDDPVELADLTALVSDVDFYWVNQREPDTTDTGSRQEPFSGWLEAVVDENPAYDLSTLEAGDIVIHYYESELIGYSEVLKEAQVTDRNGEQIYRVKVDPNPFDEPIDRDTFAGLLSRDAEGFDDLPVFLNGYQGYLYDLSEPAAELVVDCFVEWFDVEGGESINNTQRLKSRLTLPKIAPTVPNSLYFEDAESLEKEIKASLNSGKHIIFTGPPGTGKSKLAEHITQQAKKLDPVDDVKFSTATAEWTAYDTIGGYMPGKDSNEGSLEFNEGQFLRCFRSEGGNIVNRWLIIDEINRADIDKAFGQLFSVLSEDSVELPYERDGPIRISWVDTDQGVEAIATNPDCYPVTPAWRLIGTMNTADKTSLYEMSFAFMRRFNFIHVGLPGLETEDGDVRASLLQPSDTGESEKENFTTAWRKSVSNHEPFIETVRDLYPSLAVMWANLSEYRPIGPSIIFDIIRYVQEYVDDPSDDEERQTALTRAIVSLVYPQLEGMRPDQQRELIQELPTARDVDAGERPTAFLDEELLEAKAADMFAIEFTDEDES